MTIQEPIPHERRSSLPERLSSASFLASLYLIHAVAVAVCFAQLLAQKFLPSRRALSGTPRSPVRALEPLEPKPSPIEPTLRQPDVPLALHASAATVPQWDTQLLEYTHDAIIIWEMQGAGILYWNRAAEQLYGYSRSEAHSQTTHQLLRTQLAGGVTQLESDLARFGVWVGELRHTRRDGHRVDVEGRLALMSQRNGRWLVLEVNRDITDRKAAEAARCAMERQLAQLRALQDVYRDE